jgi:hypothetical protein
MEITIIMIVVIADAIKDGLEGRGSAPWWKWHVFKWIAFYTPMGVLVYSYLARFAFHPFEVLFILIYAVLCKVIWKMIYMLTQRWVEKHK